MILPYESSRLHLTPRKEGLYIMTFPSALLIVYILASSCFIFTPTDAASLSFTPQFHSIASPSSNTTLSYSNTRCIVPSQHETYPPVTVAICRPAIMRLRRQRDIDIPRLYRYNNNPIPIANFFGCRISIDVQRKEAGIVVAKRKIVDGAWRLMWACEEYGHGGWTDLEGYEGYPGWIVIVEGVSDGESGVVK